MDKEHLYELSPNRLTEINQLIVIGDIHGDYTSFQKAQSIFDSTQDQIIFLGDYADRGANGVEVIEDLNKLLQQYPMRVIALKGNHEDYTPSGNPRFHPCSLIYEAEQKRESWVVFFRRKIKPFISKLYLAALIPGEVLFVHGGVARTIGSIDELKSPTNLIEQMVLWSDPYEGRGEYSNMRGRGVLFGNDVSKEVCRKLGVKRIIRSHQPRKAWNAPCVEHDGRVITISSTRVYGNRAFALKLPVKNLDAAFQDLNRYVVYL